MLLLGGVSAGGVATVVFAQQVNINERRRSVVVAVGFTINFCKINNLREREQQNNSGLKNRGHANSQPDYVSTYHFLVYVTIFIYTRRFCIRVYLL